MLPADFAADRGSDGSRRVGPGGRPVGACKLAAGDVVLGVVSGYLVMLTLTILLKGA